MMSTLYLLIIALHVFDERFTRFPYVTLHSIYNFLTLIHHNYVMHIL